VHVLVKYKLFKEHARRNNKENGALSWNMKPNSAPQR